MNVDMKTTNRHATIVQPERGGRGRERKRERGKGERERERKRGRGTMR